ncbi:MAG: efflux RND transporter periplasmic adaptor subunit [Sphingomonas bacterium]
MNYETGSLDGQPLAIEGPDRARRRRRAFILAAVGVLVVGGGGYAWTHRGEDAAHVSPADQAPNVTVIVPGNAPVGRIINATGSLAAKRDMPVGVAGEGGMVTRVLVEPGQWVTAGQVLATVDRSVQAQTAASLNAQIGVAKSDLVLAQQELERAEQLVGRGFISQADVQRRIATRDAAAARLKVAQAASAEQGARNRRLDIRAPEPGLILTRQVEPGQIISSASGTLFRMAKSGEIEMQAQLAENDLAKIRVGDSATVTPVGDTRTFSGKVWQVAPVIDPRTRQGIVRVQLAYDPALRPGGFASVTLVGGTGNEPQLPQSAIMSDDRGNFVYIIGPDDKVVRRDVRLGTVTDRMVAIADGLTGKERVVRSAGAFLNPGQKVKPILDKTGG